jgi:hypothetical protein
MTEKEQRIWDAAFAAAVCQFGHNADPEEIVLKCEAWANNAVRTYRASSRRWNGGWVS